jgi:hypothetical protein
MTLKYVTPVLAAYILAFWHLDDQDNLRHIVGSGRKWWKETEDDLGGPLGMKKAKELSDPNSCMNRARPDEWTFVLLARDAAAPSTIRYWAAERIRLGKNNLSDPQILEALACANAMELEKRS